MILSYLSGSSRNEKANSQRTLTQTDSPVEITHTHHNSPNTHNAEQGELYQLCPCADGYVCDKGICKRDTNQPCLTSFECAGDSICHDGVCTSKPGEWESPIENLCKKGLEIVDTNLMCLSDSSFKLVDNLKSIENIIDVCSYNTGMLIITHDKLYYIKDKNIKEIDDNRPFKHLTYKDRMFEQNGDIYLIHREKLYKLVNLNNVLQWRPYKTRSFDDTTLHDGTQVVRNGKKYTIDNSILKTTLRNSVILDGQTNNNFSPYMGLDITSKVKQIISENKNSLIYLNEDGTIYRRNYKKHITTLIQGSGHKLIKIGNDVYLISKRKCVKV